MSFRSLTKDEIKYLKFLDSSDTIELNIPLFIRLLEYAREDSKNDIDLHMIAERALKANKILNMEDYKYLCPMDKKSINLTKDEICYLKSISKDEEKVNNKSVYLIRHGKTRLNNDVDTSVDRIRGWKDIPLSKEGNEEVEKLADKLKNSGLEVIYSSDLERTKETAEGISKSSGAELIFTKTLRPWNLGEFAGQTTKEALPKIAIYVRQYPNKPVPDGESFNSFKNRTFQGIEHILKESSNKKIGLVTHHRVERLLKSWIANGCPKNHDIDLDVFLQKGEPPGKVESINLPLNMG